MFSQVLRLNCGALLLAMMFVAAGVFAAEPTVDAAMTAVADSAPESEAEFKAMAQVIATAQRLKIPPQVPKAALDAAAATAFDKAARAAPWVAEYQFQRGQQLVKGGRNIPASYAFALYLRAAPQAKDRQEVAQLIGALNGTLGQAGGDALSPASTLPTSAGAVFRECPECPEMVVIPPGRLNMGSPPTERGRFDSEGPQHVVALQSFALGRFDVTQKEFSAFLAKTGYQPAPCDTIMGKSWRSLGDGLVYPPGTADLREQPAICVNVRDVEAYLDWLNRKVGATNGKGRYRLPSEAEWEYAARANTVTSRWWGEPVGVNNANCHGCGSQWDNTLIAPAGSFGPNPFGLYDILGNVWQWTADCWNESYAGAPADGRPWLTGDCTRRVIRGGSWSNLPVFIRSAARGKASIEGHDFDLFSYVGFRVARDLP